SSAAACRGRPTARSASSCARAPRRGTRARCRRRASPSADCWRPRPRASAATRGSLRTAHKYSAPYLWVDVNYDLADDGLEIFVEDRVGLKLKWVAPNADIRCWVKCLTRWA